MYTKDTKSLRGSAICLYPQEVTWFGNMPMSTGSDRENVTL
jgi:hypothetical protein